MTKNNFDLEERTAKFAEHGRDYAKQLSRNQAHLEYGKQLIRSTGSVAGNYIEANEALSKKDFFMRIKICRKEAKESRLWFRLSEPTEPEKSEKERLMTEATELLKIFSAILKSAP